MGNSPALRFFHGTYLTLASQTAVPLCMALQQANPCKNEYKYCIDNLRLILSSHSGRWSTHSTSASDYKSAIKHCEGVVVSCAVGCSGGEARTLPCAPVQQSSGAGKTFEHKAQVEGRELNGVSGGEQQGGVELGSQEGVELAALAHAIPDLPSWA